MRRFLAFGLAWLAAAVVATVVAWQGVGLIGDQVTDHRPATLSASEIDRALGTATTARRSSSTTRAGRPTTTTPTTTTAPPGGAAAGAPSGAAHPSPAAPGPSATAGTPASAPPAAPVKPVTQTFALTGGTTALQFSPQGVRIVYATPRPGYEVQTGPGDNGGVRVEFEGAAGRSRIDAWWANGQPRHRIREDPASGGGGGGLDDH